MSRTLFPLVIACLVLAWLAGCGQSGPLYLPGNPSEVQEPPQEPTPEADDDEDEDDDPGRR